VPSAAVVLDGLEITNQAEKRGPNHLRGLSSPALARRAK